MEKKIDCIALFGPTASGKTSLAVELAKKYNGEVISADSMQIYQGMQIGTAKPTQEEMQGIRHHLIDFLPATEAFSVARFVEMANQCINDIVSRGKLPVIAGGTGLYIRSLLENIDFTEEEVSTEKREELMRIAAEQGGEALIRRVAEFDPDYAATLHPNNVKRIVRALERLEFSGKTWEEQMQESQAKPSRLNPCKMAIVFNDRQKLYDRINQRVDIMMEKGLLQEAEEFFVGKRGKTAVQAIGYKELFPYYQKEISLAQAVENLKQETRRYAKRQLTWIRREENISLLTADSKENKSLLEQASAVFDAFKK